MKFHACWIEFCSISKFSFISNKLGPLRPMRGRDFWKKFFVLKFILRFQVNKWDSNKLLEASDWLLNGLVSCPTFFCLAQLCTQLYCQPSILKIVISPTSWFNQLYFSTRTGGSGGTLCSWKDREVGATISPTSPFVLLPTCRPSLGPSEIDRWLGQNFKTFLELIIEHLIIFGTFFNNFLSDLFLVLLRSDTYPR